MGQRIIYHTPTVKKRKQRKTREMTPAQRAKLAAALQGNQSKS